MVCYNSQSHVNKIKLGLSLKKICGCCILIYIESSEIPLRFLILGRKFMYLWSLLRKSDEELGKRVFITQSQIQSEDSWVSVVTRPEASEGGPFITSLIEGVPSEETDRHRQRKVSFFITRMDLPL